MIFIMFKQFRLIPRTFLGCGVYKGILKYSTITKITSNKGKLPNVTDFASELSEKELKNYLINLH